METARAAQLQSVKLVTTIAKYGFLPASKLVMQMLGVDCGIARPPLATLDAEQLESLRRDLEAIGFFDQVTVPFAASTSPSR